MDCNGGGKELRESALIAMYCSFLQTVYVEFSNTGTCFSSVGRTYWPFPVAQERYHERVREIERETHTEDSQNVGTK